MKKNLMSVIILALCFANLVLSAVLMFTVLPETKKANALIDDICSAISLDLNSGAATSTSNIPIDEIEVYSVNGGSTITTNLADDGTGSTCYIVFAITLSLNTNSDNYAVYTQDVLTERDTIISNAILKIVKSHTLDEVESDLDSIEDEILVEMQDMFGSDYIVGVNIPSITTTRNE